MGSHQESKLQSSIFQLQKITLTKAMKDVDLLNFLRGGGVVGLGFLVFLWIKWKYKQSHVNRMDSLEEQTRHTKLLKEGYETHIEQLKQSFDISQKDSEERVEKVAKRLVTMEYDAEFNLQSISAMRIEVDEHIECIRDLRQEIGEKEIEIGIKDKKIGWLERLVNELRAC